MAAMSKFAVLLGGTVIPTPRLRDQLKGARIIAADSGMRHTAPLRLTPELWVGDFDSADKALQQHYAHLPRIAFAKDKDATDGELAVHEALARGATELVLVGAFGGQFDHMLAHAAMLVGLAERGIHAVASSGREEAWPLVGALSLQQLQKGTRVSIVGLTALHGLTLRGVRWPLQDCDVAMGSTLTLSNEAEGSVSISIAAGRAVVLVYPGSA
jgi:thiamine pyrophosphokinase